MDDVIWEVYTDAKVAAEERDSFALDPPVSRNDMLSRILTYQRHVVLKGGVGVLGVQDVHIQLAPQSMSIMDNLSEDVEKRMVADWTAKAPKLVTSRLGTQRLRTRECVSQRLQKNSPGHCRDLRPARVMTSMT